jgi:hypothetical protein
MSVRQNRSAEAVWSRRLERFAEHELTVKEFCRRERVSEASYYYWRRRLPGRRTGRRATEGLGGNPEKKAVPFVPVRISAPTLAEVEFPNGIRVRVPVTNAEALRVVLAAGAELCGEVPRC